ncbi:sodium/hydrogen exchanger 1-like [Rutidosis leptorrhynchoides]|uniref:sodium/hydrogen exchanger 1-like n=1 Tax=Rutidosis leptorrhynchoides TaxID=125765 RepID=UPI003A9A07A4
MTIASFGVIGTLISFAIISFGATQLFRKFDLGYLELKDYLALGAIFSATDSVCTLQVLNQEETPLLYSLVFGEGVVNDATSVVLFNAIMTFNLSDINPTVALSFGWSFLKLFVGSTFLGVFVGLLCAFIIRTLFHRRNSTDHDKNSTDREVALMLLMAYLSYITANVCNLSGILAVFFCGIVMSHYAWNTVTHKSQVTTEHSFATISYIAEVFIFLYVGMDSLDVEKWQFVTDSPGKSIWASGILLVLIMVGRAGFILPLSYLSNLSRRGSNEKIGIKQQFIVWWAGLMRGAVSVALAYKKFTGSGQTIQPANALLITSTITVVLFSTVVFGLLTKPIIRMLHPHLDETQPSSPTSSRLPLLANGHDRDHDPEAENGNHRTLTTRPSLKMLLGSPTHAVHDFWRKFDDKYMRPIFGGSESVSFDTGTGDVDLSH